METLLTHGSTILLFIIVLGMLVLAHELGHFLAARFFGMDVEEFGFGYPPRIFGFKKGKTLYSFNWIPLGGFVKVKGEEDPDSKDPAAFANKPAWNRVIVTCAGVFMNLVLSSALFAVGLTVGMPQAVSDLPANARVRDPQVQIVEVMKGTPAEQAGFMAGDIIVAINGQSFQKIQDIQAFVNASESSVDIGIRRGKKTFTSELAPVLEPTLGKRVMGVGLIEVATVSYPWYTAIGKGILATGFYLKEILSSFADLFKSLFIGQKTNVEFSGPVGIAVLTGRAARLGFSYLLQFAALLSINLAVINILPIPVLDGGRLLFIIIEKIRGRSVRPVVEAVVYRIAFFLLLGLIVIVTAKDLSRYGEQILKALGSLIGVS
jgi:regulator of sigma E protease